MAPVQGYAGLSAFSGLARKKSRGNKVSRKGARIEKVCTIVNVLFSALTSAHKNITFAVSTLKQKSYAERKSQLSGSLRSVSPVQ
jgi:hypothetical protein